VCAAELTDSLKIEKGYRNRMIVNPTLHLPQYPETYVIGDAAYLEDENGKPLPLLATVALQQARLVAENIRQIAEQTPAC